MPDTKLHGAVLVAQSGGPTAVINASAYGVIKTALESEAVTKVYAGEHGMKGILNERLMIMDEEDAAELSRMMYTPSSVLGSCRYKMADPSREQGDYQRLMEIFRKYDIRYFFYNGGNDSMDTCEKVSRFMRSSGWECRVIGVPKTIDNDLYGTDHCPGFASAAKYIATSVMEIRRDSGVYDTGAVTIIECMGRHAGWLTAAAKLASVSGEGPDLIYVPESDFSMERFLADTENVYRAEKNCIIAVSEGIHYEDGTFVAEAKTSATDGFGHAQLGGLSAYLAQTVKENIGCKVRGIELSLLQRSAAHCASGTDIQESFLVGKAAVEAALSGLSDKMIGFSCERNGGYRCETVPVNLSEVANFEKKLPKSWINDAGNNIGQEFIDYALPLIQGETMMEKENGLPRFARLKKVFV